MLSTKTFTADSVCPTVNDPTSNCGGSTYVICSIWNHNKILNNDASDDFYASGTLVSKIISYKTNII